ncbi:MAG: hypothetical protein D6795_15605, partial [Deltaproteobacteria bacterium]
MPDEGDAWLFCSLLSWGAPAAAGGEAKIPPERSPKRRERMLLPWGERPDPPRGAAGARGAAA